MQKKKVNSLIPVNESKFLEYIRELVSTKSVSYIRAKMQKAWSKGEAFHDEGGFYHVFKFPKQGYVVKVIKQDDFPKDYLHESPKSESVIAKFFLFPVISTENEAVIVQHLVDTSLKQQEKAFQFIYGKLIDHLEPKRIRVFDVWPDAHSGNVGMLNGRPVIIDYSHAHMR